MELLSILQLRQRDPLTLRGAARRDDDAIAALRDVDRPFVFAEIESRYGADTADRKSPLQRKIISVQPATEHQSSVDPGRRRQSVVPAKIQQAAAVADVRRRRCSCNRRRQTEIRDVANSMFVL